MPGGGVDLSWYRCRWCGEYLYEPVEIDEHFGNLHKRCKATLQAFREARQATAALPPPKTRPDGSWLIERLEYEQLHAGRYHGGGKPRGKPPKPKNRAHDYEACADGGLVSVCGKVRVRELPPPDARKDKCLRCAAKKERSEPIEL